MSESDQPDLNPTPAPAGRRWAIWLPAVALPLAAATLFGLFYLDGPITAAIRGTRQVQCDGSMGEIVFKRGELGRMLQFFEAYGHGLAAVAALAIVLAVARHWRTAVRMAAAMAASTLIYLTLARAIFNRVRPHAWTAWQAGDVFSSFAARGDSFPSGHAATAFAFSIVLAATYPRGRWVFLSLAAACGVARVLTLDHFASDVFAGACIGTTAGLWAARSRLLGTLCDRIAVRHGLRT
jgi:membrane-associated phospholipid phosphatase